MQLLAMAKVIYPKYSKHWSYTVAHTINCVCSKMLNHSLNHGLFLSLFKLIRCPMHWIVHLLAYLNFKVVSALPKMARSAQKHKSISFICIFGALYMYISDFTLIWIIDFAGWPIHAKLWHNSSLYETTSKTIFY